MNNKRLKIIYISIAVLFVALIIVAIVTSPAKDTQQKNTTTNAPTLNINNNISSNVTQFNIKFTLPQLPKSVSTYKISGLSDDNLKKIADNLKLPTKEVDTGLKLIKYKDQSNNYISYQQSTQDFMLVNNNKNDLNGYTEQNLLTKLALDLSYNFADYKFQSVKDILGTDQKLYSFTLNIKSYKLYRDYGQDFVLGVYIDKSGVLKKIEWKYSSITEDSTYTPQNINNILNNFTKISKGVYPNFGKSTQVTIETLTNETSFNGIIDANSVEIAYVWSDAQSLAIPVYVFNCNFSDVNGTKTNGTVIVSAI